MQFVFTFLEGFIAFISPCTLPLLPVYISYFAGSKNDTRYTFFRTLFFVLGFSLIFVLMGVFAGSIGQFLHTYNRIVSIVCGIIIIIFGLSYLELFTLPFFKGMSGIKVSESFFSAFIFGIIYSVSLSPCTGAFLGSALMMASSSGSVIQGALLLLCYSLGLGLPFMLSALLLNYLKSAFSFIKSHYKIINRISGSLLIIIGLLMVFGLFYKIF
jgi:cytochrome c-type biogenesis protein